MSSTHPARRRRRAPVLIASALALGTALAVAVPLAASAHVTIGPDRAAAGSFASLQVRVPTESDTATTTKLVVELPTDHPLPFVLYQPTPGWSTEVTREKLPKPITVGDDTVTEGVTRITWTAEPGSELPSGAIEAFGVTVGPIPKVDLLRFPAHQYYSDGTVVDWTDAEESAEHPAPRLYVEEAPPGETDTATASSATPAAVVTPAAPDTVARILGGAGLLVGAAGVIVAVLALRRRAER